MNYLFIHQNFPGQYRQLVRWLADRRGNRVSFISQPNRNDMVGVRKIVYEKPVVNSLDCHPFTVEFDLAMRNGVAVAEVCRRLREQGERPDIIVGHCGWGETLFVKDVFPDTPLLGLFEFYYHAQGVDVGFDPEHVSVFNDPSHVRARNATALLAFDSADWGHAATRWQRNLHPPEMRSRITAIHEGVDTDLIRPQPDAWVNLGNGVRLTRADEVITYVARNLEPYRGFHVFMRALPEILRRRPRAHVLVVGGDEVGYGAPAAPRSSFRETLLAEVGAGLDLERVHFLGQIDYAAYRTVLQVSSAHVYLTYPFVLSWSFVEALAAGCLVIGSATPPVQEFLRDGVNGLLVDFFSPAELAARVEQVLAHRNRMQALRDGARRTAVGVFDLKRRLLPRWERLLDDLVEGRRPELDCY